MALVICGHSAVRGEPVLCSEAGSESALSLQAPSRAIHKHLDLKFAFPWDNAKKGISPKRLHAQLKQIPIGFLFWSILLCLERTLLLARYTEKVEECIAKTIGGRSFHQKNIKWQERYSCWAIGLYNCPGISVLKLVGVFPVKQFFHQKMIIWYIWNYPQLYIDFL